MENLPIVGSVAMALASFLPRVPPLLQSQCFVRSLGAQDPSEGPHHFLFFMSLSLLFVPPIPTFTRLKTIHTGPSSTFLNHVK